jgi:hypothetical protein
MVKSEQNKGTTAAFRLPEYSEDGGNDR